MKLTYYTPAKLFDSLICQYEHVDAYGEVISIKDSHIPTGYASLVFNVSGEAYLYGDRKQLLPCAFMVLPCFNSKLVGIYGDVDSFIVTCNASKLSKLLTMNFRHDGAAHVALDNCHSHLFDLIKQSKGVVEERIAAVQNFFMAVGYSNYEEDEIDLLYNDIISDHGVGTITSLLESYDHSPRYFRKHFTERVGVNPKVLTRIVRVNRLWRLIENDHAIDYQDMVFEGEYFDQSHLIRDFKLIVGETPSYFFKRNLDHARLMSGQ